MSVTFGDMPPYGIKAMLEWQAGGWPTHDERFWFLAALNLITVWEQDGGTPEEFIAELGERK